MNVKFIFISEDMLILDVIWVVRSIILDQLKPVGENSVNLFFQ